MPSAKCGGFKKQELGKFLVVRRDGTIPSWTWFVLGARDPFAPAALRAYAAKVDEAKWKVIEANNRRPTHESERLHVYSDDILALADAFDAERAATGSGDPEAGPHRIDNEWILTLMRSNGSADLSRIDASAITINLKPR